MKMWCWRTFLPRCSRTFGFGESIKSRGGAHSRKFHFRDGFQALQARRWPIDLSTSRTVPSREHQTRYSARIRMKILNLRPRRKCQVSGIGRRDRIPPVSRFDGSDRMAFLAFFFSFFFLFHLWNAISKLVLLEYFRVGLLSWNALRAGLVLWVVLHNFIEEFVTNYLRGICLWNSFTSYSAFTIGCITGGIGFAYITWILRKKFQFLSGDKIFFSFSLHILLVIKYSNNQYGKE